MSGPPDLARNHDKYLAFPVELVGVERENFGGRCTAVVLAAVATGALLAGLGSAFGSEISMTVTQQRVPPDALARARAFNMAGAFAFGPIAFTAAGPVAAVLGARTVLGSGAAWAALGTAAVLAVPSVRRVTWPTGPVSPDETGRPPS